MFTILPPTVTVNSPPAIAGVKSAGTAAFGPQSFDLTADLVEVDDGVGTGNDGCEVPFTSDVNGKIAFMDRGRLLENSDKEEFLERWRRIEVQLEPGAVLPVLPDIVAQAGEGRFRTLTTNRFDGAQLALLGDVVRGVQRMSLEEIFVANVMHHRETHNP